MLFRRSRRIGDCGKHTAVSAASLLEPGRTCWRVEPADRFACLVDGADYFRHAKAAMLRARRRILLVGWDFDTRIA